MMVAFLPWLKLRQAVEVAGTRFVPWRDNVDQVSVDLRDVAGPLEIILSSYVEREGEPISNCVVITRPGKPTPWSLDGEDEEPIRWSALLLFLAAFAENDYFSAAGNYVNSTAFEIIWQRYAEPLPNGIAIVSKRRDGRSTDGGYEHGKARFSRPIWCDVHPVHYNGALLAAMNTSPATSETIEQLEPALPFVSLANTDNPAMSFPSEAILMASAFEVMVKSDNDKKKLRDRFSGPFTPFGSATVADAQVNRSGIVIDTSQPDRAEAQPRWFVHKKWIEELYDLRSKSAHRAGDISSRTWGWTPFEHLLMAAFVFPLFIKLKLEGEGRYVLTHDDKSRCFAVDSLLAAPRWDDANSSSRQYRWVEELNEASFSMTSRMAMKYLEEAARSGAVPTEDEST